jgi:diguanylate cyclase (GGDEF)-like protein
METQKAQNATIPPVQTSYSIDWHNMDNIPSNELPFGGFDEFIRQPLESVDSKSFIAIKNLFPEGKTPGNNPFSFLIKRIAGKSLTEYKAREHWRNILLHKKEMETKLRRVIRVQTAAVDYFSIINEMEYTVFIKSMAVQNESKSGVGTTGKEWQDNINSLDYYSEKLKDEMARSKRYNHSLSLIMFQIDNFTTFSSAESSAAIESIVTFIVKVIKKTIRNVDILARYSEERFLIILPNTNKREATELAERIRENVATRSKRSPDITKGITLTLSVAQSSNTDKSTELTKHLESILVSGMKQQNDKVYSL